MEYIILSFALVILFTIGFLYIITKWFRYECSLYNVKHYGAKGDGVTDDTIAIQKALDAANKNYKGGTVFLPNGMYKTTQPINTTGVFCIKNDVGGSR